MKVWGPFEGLVLIWGVSVIAGFGLASGVGLFTVVLRLIAG